MLGLSWQLFAGCCKKQGRDKRYYIVLLLWINYFPMKITHTDYKITRKKIRYKSPDTLIPPPNVQGPIIVDNFFQVIQNSAKNPLPSVIGDVVIFVAVTMWYFNYESESKKTGDNIGLKYLYVRCAILLFDEPKKKPSHRLYGKRASVRFRNDKR